MYTHEVSAQFVHLQIDCESSRYFTDEKVTCLYLLSNDGHLFSLKLGDGPESTQVSEEEFDLTCGVENTIAVDRQTV